MHATIGENRVYAPLIPGRIILFFAFFFCLTLFPISIHAEEAQPKFLPELERILDGQTATDNNSGITDDKTAVQKPRANKSMPASSAAAAGNLYPELRVRVTSPRHTVLSSQASGRVDRIPVRDGDRFAAGNTLVSIDPSFEQIQLKKAQANLQRQQLIMKMTEELVELQTRGELELDLAKADVKQAEAEVEFIQARLSRMQVSAPFSGRVGDILIKEFQVVAEGQPLVEIIGDEEMELEFIVSSMWMRWFKPGFAFTVRIDELGKEYHAVLERLGGKVDPLSKSVKAYAKLTDADSALFEGMSGEAFIVPPDGETR